MAFHSLAGTITYQVNLFTRYDNHFKMKKVNTKRTVRIINHMFVNSFWDYGYSIVVSRSDNELVLFEIKLYIKLFTNSVSASETAIH